MHSRWHHLHVSCFIRYVQRFRMFCKVVFRYFWNCTSLHCFKPSITDVFVILPHRVIIQPPVNQTGGNLAIYSQKPGEDLPLNGTSKQKPLNSTKTKSIINKETVGNTELPLLKVNGSYHTQVCELHNIDSAWMDIASRRLGRTFDEDGKSIIVSI